MRLAPDPAVPGGSLGGASAPVGRGAESRPRAWRNRPGAWLSVAAAGAGVAGVLWKFDPRTAGFFPPCPFHAATGLYCPGCGSTRALHALAHGDLAASFRYNALFTLTLPLLVVLVAGECFAPARHGTWSTRVPARWVWTFFGVVVAFWVARNLPFYPCTLLAPH